MRPIEPHRNIGELAVELPAATLVFIRRGIDFCCRGPRSLITACGAGLIKANQIAEEIERNIHTQVRLQPADGTLQALVDFIIEKYLRATLSKLSAVEFLAAKTAAANCAGNQKSRSRIQPVIADLATCIRTQLHLKESVLFPAVLSGESPFSRVVFRDVRTSQADAVRHFQTLHRLSFGFDPLRFKCFSEKAMMTLLKDLSTDFGAQLHAEQHLLYPG